MNKIIITILLLLTSNIFAYVTKYDGSDGMCDEYADFQIEVSSFPTYWQSMIEEIAKNAANWWNEAGSEHHLYYAGVGESNPEIEYGEAANDGDKCDSDSVACCTTVTNLYCIVTSWSWITIDNDYWNTNDFKNSYQLQNTITHEFGHLLGLDHTQDEDDYPAILMDPGYFQYRHLTEDDKKGARAIYGEDDQNIRVGSATTDFIPNNSPTVFASGNSDYRTFAKPQLVFQPNRTLGYDYIMAWVKSNTNEINYQFVNDSGSNYNSLTAASGTLGKRHYINNKLTLTTPSIAISSNGNNAVMVWKQELENQEQRNANDIWFAKIPTFAHDFQIDECGSNSDCLAYPSRKLYDNSTLGNSSYSNFKAKTISQPKVVWVSNWSKFVIFYTALGGDNLKIAYIVSSDSQGNFPINPTPQYLNLYSNWNPFEINCEQVYYIQSSRKMACLLVFNEINKDANTSFADNVAKTTYKILEPTSTEGTFLVKDITKTGNWDRKGYGHYSIMSVTNTLDTVSIINRITKAGKEVVNNLKIRLSRTMSTGVWSGTMEEEATSSTSYYSRTGYSMVYNPIKSLYKFLWIEE